MDDLTYQFGITASYNEVVDIDQKKLTRDPACRRVNNDESERNVTNPIIRRKFRVPHTRLGCLFEFIYSLVQATNMLRELESCIPVGWAMYTFSVK